MNFPACLARPVLAALLLLVAACSAPPPSPPRVTPAASAWSRDGEHLACVENDRRSGRLEIRDRHGQLRDLRQMPGPILAVTWSARDDLLVVGYRLREFSFGANLAQWLVRINSEGEETIALGDVTLESSTVRQFAAGLPLLLGVFFSPSGDELVFTQVHDPPQAPPYLQLLYRNWQVPAARKLFALPLAPVSVTWNESGDAITWRLGEDPPRQHILWPLQGERMPGGAPLAPGKDTERLWSLRKWRFEGLITPDEYAQAAEEERRP